MEAPEARFLRFVFVDGEGFWQFPGSFVPDGRYRVQSSKLAAAYAAWLGAPARGAFGSVPGVTRARTAVCTYYVFDVPRVCEFLGARPCADFERCVR